MKTNIKMCRFFTFFLCIIFFFNLFVLNCFTKYKPILAVFLICYWLSFRLFVKPKEFKTLSKRYVTLWFIVLGILFLIIWYGLGFFYNYKISDGFYTNPINYILNPTWTWIFPHSIIIIYSELMRTLVIVQNDKKSNIGITIAMVLIDIIVNINIYHHSNIGGILEIMGCLILPSISINLLFNYISKRYGSGPNILFRLVIIIVYNYFMTILPDIYPIVETLIKIVYPFIIYLIIDALFETKLEVNN